MSRKRYYFDKNIECCLTCTFIDEYSMNVADKGEEPCGYDGGAFCGAWNSDEQESPDNRFIVSPTWLKCKKYKRCTERQADYLDIWSSKEDKIIPNKEDISEIS